MGPNYYKSIEEKRLKNILMFKITEQDRFWIYKI
jgi:hypothetical protein